MPKSKRAKVVTLTKTLKKARPAKAAHLDLIRECVEKYSHIYIIRVQNMRNNLLKTVRGDWSTSRFFFGKNKLVSVALGRTADDEYKENLSQLSTFLKGDCGVMFTNSPSSEVQSYFESAQVDEFARSGFVSTVDFTVPAGVIDMPFSMETTLRQLGMDTKLNKGVIELARNHKKIAVFKIVPLCVWSDGRFESFVDVDMQE
ncbi:unnamed protein product (mitochondrion) [Plasmodiophora brassicae]|uniref:Ribosome assembly factor mrt4 n=1 Tax=Plasmodiophora brassicae TaxID=37360 RepID=A0A3P3YHH2_PLABS|nr:unnamed protein product [Plasmodiophora brassicae]